MHIKRHTWKIDLQIVLVPILALGAATFVSCDTAQAKFKVLYAFDWSDGSQPNAPLLMKWPDLYGTTYVGGAYSDGTVFKLAPDGTETVPHSFTGADGVLPNGGLIMDKVGNLYGTSATPGYGAVYRLAPGGSLTTLYTFTGESDGRAPNPSLIMDKTGNLYGTTALGGAYRGGTVFKLAPDGTKTVLHAFSGPDGWWINGGLIMDRAGNLYGTSSQGGAFNTSGTAFKLAPGGTLSVLHSFARGSDGGFPNAGLIMDDAGNLYGTTERGGVDDHGVVFKISPDGQLTTLYAFRGGSDGERPRGVIADALGSLYGVTNAGGDNGVGNVYRLAPDGTHTLLHTFRKRKDGGRPEDSLIIGARGKLYGTAPAYGPHGDGTVFSLRPQD